LAPTGQAPTHATASDSIALPMEENPTPTHRAVPSLELQLVGHQQSRAAVAMVKTVHQVMNPQTNWGVAANLVVGGLPAVGVGGGVGYGLRKAIESPLGGFFGTIAACLTVLAEMGAGSRADKFAGPRAGVLEPIKDSAGVDRTAQVEKLVHKLIEIAPDSNTKTELAAELLKLMGSDVFRENLADLAQGSATAAAGFLRAADGSWCPDYQSPELAECLIKILSNIRSNDPSQQTASPSSISAQRNALRSAAMCSTDRERYCQDLRNDTASAAEKQAAEAGLNGHVPLLNHNEYLKVNKELMNIYNGLGSTNPPNADNSNAVRKLVRLALNSSTSAPMPLDPEILLDQVILDMRERLATTD
jgi:hypothetical protein